MSSLRRTSQPLLGLFALGALSVGLMISCGKDDSSAPTAPTVPLFPAGQSSEYSNEMGFYSSNGDGQFGAWAGDCSEFLVGVPAGDFLLTYRTTLGAFYRYEH